MRKKFLSSVLLFHILILLVGFAVLTKPPTYVLSVSNSLVISEVQIAGTGGVGEDFVELYNASDTDIDLSGYRLVKRTATGSADASLKAWDSEAIIPAHGYYLWANSGWTPAVTPDATTAATLAANNGVALRLGPEDSGAIIDSVAWGTASNAFVETTAFADNPAAGQSMERKPGAANPTGGNAVDTDHNANDFVLRETSEPQNTASAVEIPVAGPSPSPLVTPSPTPTAEPSPSASPIASPSPSPEASPSPTPIPSVSPSPSPVVSPTPTPVPTPSPSVSPSPSPEPTPNPSPTPTMVPTPSPSVSPTPLPTPTPSPSTEPTPQPSPTPFPSVDPSPSASPTPAPSTLPSPLPSPSPSVSPTPKPSSRIIFDGVLFQCRVTYRYIKFFRSTMRIPSFSCYSK